MLTKHVIDVFSKEKIKEFLSSSPQLPGVVLISILDPDDIESLPKHLLDKVEDSLTVRFWDIEKHIGKYKPISDNTAKLIAEFIWKHRDKKFLVHCTAGISRSAAVALAIECILEHHGNKREFALKGCPGITGNPRFLPNCFVFNKVIEAFNKMSVIT